MRLYVGRGASAMALLAALGLACSDGGPGGSDSYFDVSRVSAGLDRLLPVLQDSALVAVNYLASPMNVVIGTPARPPAYGVLPDELLGKRFEFGADGANYTEATTPASDAESVEFVLYVCDALTWLPVLPLQQVGMYQVRNGEPMVLTVTHGRDTVAAATVSFGTFKLFSKSVAMTGSLQVAGESPSITLAKWEDDFVFYTRDTLRLLGPPESVLLEGSGRSGTFSEGTTSLVIGSDRLTAYSSQTDFKTHVSANDVEIMVDWTPVSGVHLSQDALAALADLRSALNGARIMANLIWTIYPLSALSHG